jgi:hypothetical protein
LFQTLLHRDVAKLQTLVAEDIAFSFGDGEGWGLFSRSWNLSEPLTSGLWTALAETLMLGCADSDGSMVAPYAFAKWPGTEEIASSYLAYPGATLHSAPDPSSDFRDISWQIVFHADDAGTAPAGWARVRTGQGSVGYVDTGSLRIDIDYRAIFEKRGGRWVLATFIAGD